MENHGSEASTSHPSPEELVALAESRLDAPTAEQLGAHLEGCAACRKMVDDLRDFDELEAPGEAWRVSEVELESTLAALKQRLPVAAETGSSLPSLVPVPSSEEATTAYEQIDRGSWRWLPWAAVALLSLGMVILYSDNRSLQDDQQGASQAHSSDLVNAASEASERDSLDCYLSDRVASLILSSARDLEPGPYAVIFRRDGDTEALRLELEIERPARLVALEVAARAVGPGDYDIILYNVDREQKVAVFPVCFRAPQGSG